MFDRSVPPSPSDMDAPAPPPRLGGFARDMRARVQIGRALQEDRVRLAFQPVVRASATSRVSFWECLARIRTRDGGVMAPGAFLPAIAGTTLATMLDCEVLRQTLNCLAARPDLRLSVNVGPDAFAHPEWTAALTEGLAAAPGIAARLIVEVTEDVATETARDAEAFLTDLKIRGISVALDDFGGGTTSIRQFRTMRFDILKLDGGLCRGLHRDRDAQVLVGAMVGIARHYEMLTVAEHVDSREGAAAATAAGIDALQGYLFGKPEMTLPLRDDKGTARKVV